MRLSTLFGRTLREEPNEAESIAHQLVLRAGLARALLAGGYVLLPLGMQVVRRIATMMHTEMMRIGGQEFRTPIIQSAAAWEQTGRYDDYGPLMLRLTDRNERALVVAPTHEEAVAELARREITSYRQMPTLVYQIHTKYCDEIRPKGGLLRTREFTMLDAYSLDEDEAGLDHAYEQTAQAFAQILVQCGVEYITVEAVADTMGACASHTYMVISPAGDEIMVLCPLCGYAANLKVATRAAHTPVDTANDPATELTATPHCATIADLATLLNIHTATTAKAVFFTTPERGLLFVVIRGDLEVNEAKLQAVAGVSALAPASTEQIVATGAVPGYASPVGLHGVTVIADRSVVTAGPLVAGANQAGYHLRNVVYGRDWQATQTADIATVRTDDPCPRCRGPLALEQGIEIGHIAKLGTRYTEALGATYLNSQGMVQPIVMGSYGIGIERLIQVIVEQHHDEAGIVWPATVAPADVQLVRLGKNEQIVRTANELYTQLRSAGVRVLYDDRNESAGVKFNDADLIGLPVRLLISERLLATDSVEIKPRAGTAIQVQRTEVLAAVRTMLAERPSD